MKRNVLRFDMESVVQLINLRRRKLVTVCTLLALMLSAPLAQAQNIQLELPEIEAAVGEEITIPVEAINIADKGVYAITLRIAYDPEILSDEEFSASTAGTSLAGKGQLSQTTVKAPDAGYFTINYIVSTGSPVDSDGTLINFSTTVVGEGSTSLELSFILLENDDGSVETTATAGSFITVASTDPDGIYDHIEDAVPNPDGEGTGDGNGDGIADSQQENVASFLNGTDESYVTVEAAAGASLSNVSASSTIPAGVPDGVELPDGAMEFGVSGLSAGASTTVTLYTTKEATGYFKYGPTPDNPSDHWYPFNYDGTTGAEIMSDRIVLHFVDGMRGDADLAANGVIADPGGPAFYSNLAPSAAVITSPGEGSEYTIGGDEGEDPEDASTTLFTMQWDASVDSDGDDVSYEVQVSGEESFSSALATVANGAATELAVTVGQAADWFDEAAGGADVGASETLYFRVVSSDGQAETTSETTSVTFLRGTVTSAEYGELPGGFELRGNYPNPFNPSTTIRFDLPESANVTVEVFDILGRHVLSVPATSMQAGADRSVRIDAGHLSSGNYLYRVTAETTTDTMVRVGRMTLLK